ncbi:MAG TPA: hypothetical protein VLH10_27610, partial [Yinghuangia sp.]|nr:hypothetical protein [Yinghuangia sp.]
MGIARRRNRCRLPRHRTGIGPAVRPEQDLTGIRRHGRANQGRTAMAGFRRFGKAGLAAAK